MEVPHEVIKRTCQEQELNLGSLRAEQVFYPTTLHGR